MRAKTHWFRAEAARSPGEVAGALAPVAWAGARRMLASVRKAGFDVEAGDAYFAFLFEALAFEVQVAWRIVHGKYGEDSRAAFMNELARRLARTFAENRADLLGADAHEAERRFLEDLDRRMEEYAGFGHDSGGPSFAFLRCFASLVEPLLAAKDRPWIHDQVIAIEGPQAASAIASALDALLDSGAGAGAGRARQKAVGE